MKNNKLFKKEKGMNINLIVGWVSTILVIVGSLNWGLVGAFDFNLVTSLFGETTKLTRFIYVCVGLAAIYRILLLAT